MVQGIFVRIKGQLMSAQGLSIIVPVYNERDGIENTLKHLRQIFLNADFPLEIILVNDASTDGTEKVLAGLNPDDFCVVNHHINKGYGGALKTGIQKASFPHVAITDADDTYPNDRIPEFYRLTLSENLDMLVGSRTGKIVHIPLIRRLPKWVLNKLANYLTRTKIPDLNSGLRIMRKVCVLESLNILPDGFSFTTTISLSMLTNGRNVKYVPIDYNERKGRSKIRAF